MAEERTTPIALVYRDGAWSAISGVCNHTGGQLAGRLMASEHTLERGARGGRKAHALAADE